MNIRITNLANRLTVISLNSGRTVILGPRETSVEIPGTETKGNRTIEQMKHEGVISVQGDEIATKPAKSAQKTKTHQGKKRH
jgi:hypothetical protein